MTWGSSPFLSAEIQNKVKLELRCKIVYGLIRIAAVKLTIPSLLLFAVLMLSLSAQLSYGVGEYKNYSELSSSEQEGKDFEIISILRDSAVMVMAIHGGKIEFGTTEIASSIAGADWNYYTFSGLKQVENENWSLHLTSSNFDEPRALALAHSSTHCISVHAFKNAEVPTVCVGGKSNELGLMIANSIRSNNPNLKVEYPCLRFPAQRKQNIVNQCVNEGVQLEISVDALDEIKKTNDNYESFVKSVRGAIKEFIL
jgi:phage replication-related protein YjqB (UPF0714/DUF867 family)